MIDRKRFREITGFTRTKVASDAENWHRLANSFRLAAEILEDFEERIPEDTRPFALNAALSLELLFKAILAKRGSTIPDTGRGHDLLYLCSQAKVSVSDHQLRTLELLGETILWAGRYPTPKKDEQWDRYHDEVFEKHVIRFSGPKLSSIMANRDTFPNWNNYLKIWEVCEAEFAKI